MKVEFQKERETKNTIRYMELTDPAIIGTLYVQKWALKEIDKEGNYPDKLSVEITTK
jgi:hypothetical protein